MKALFNILLFLCLASSLRVTAVSAANLGTGIQCWKQEPYAYILCFEVTDTNGQYFSLIGENIIPGKSTYPVHGSALFDSKNSLFRLEFTQNLGENAFQNAVTLDKETLTGAWTDNGGNLGAFNYVGSPPLDAVLLNPSTPRHLKSHHRWFQL